MNKIKLVHSYNYIISIENLLLAWKEFVKGKRHRKDVQEFEFRLMDNIIFFHNNLAAKTYAHGNYQAFKIYDPKPRAIHKASVRDRLLHHAIYRALYPFFDKTFVSDSFSCRVSKGTYKAINRLRDFVYKISKNHTKTVWVLKCDIKKFFASIDQKILIEIIKDFIPDKNIIWLISQIIISFYSIKKNKGLPLGNLTSQLLVNIYMNKFDQFVKHKLKAKYYIRYADDFVILSQNREWFKSALPNICNFLQDKLELQLNPNKISIKTFASGVDFLGWVHFPDHRILRNNTKKRMFRNIKKKKRKTETVCSYLGLIRHGNTIKLQKEIENNL